MHEETTRERTTEKNRFNNPQRWGKWQQTKTGFDLLTKVSKQVLKNQNVAK